MELLKTILAVGAGSFLGGAGRYLVSLAMRGVSKGFPWATLTVNLVGCFLIGLLWGVFSKNGTEGSNWALFLTVGVCGGFTTFSTFMDENAAFLRSGHAAMIALYVAASLAVGFAAALLGHHLTRP